VTKPTKPKKATSNGRPRLILLGRSWCHLCDDLRAELLALPQAPAFDLDVVDVDEFPHLEQRYGNDVPVLLAGSQEICRHRLNRAAVEKYLVSLGISAAPQDQIG
jgi:thiol-disulfide isomerase/thioredoxin